MATAADTRLPKKVMPFIELGFELNRQKQSGANAYGDCPWCGGTNKFYLNVTDDEKHGGLWDCKKCGERGNISVYLQKWYALYAEDIEASVNARAYSSLSKDRQLPVQVLKDAGIVYDGDRYYIPIKNMKGQISNLRYYTVPRASAGKKIRIKGLTDLPASIFNLHLLAQAGRSREIIYICEGEWDAIALEWFLQECGLPGIVLGIPGASMFKKEWRDYFEGRDVVMCYDNDPAGADGLDRLYSSISGVVRTLKYLEWPSSITIEFDVRDFVINGGTWEAFEEMIIEFIPSDIKEDRENKEQLVEAIPIGHPDRPTWKQLLEVYREHLEMTPDLEDALRVICGVVLSTTIPGDPCWMHIVGPPGSGKTLLLVSTQTCPTTYHLSKIKPKDLMSGFIAKDGVDPSLIPRLHNRCLVIKDFTATTSMPLGMKDELYGTLRDAYDGEVAQEWANNKKVHYRSHFTVLTGVTSAIYGERSAALGERFLVFHAIRGNDYDDFEVCMTAMDGVGKEAESNAELCAVAAAFLEVTFTQRDIPEISYDYKKKMYALAKVVASLRASVDRDTFNRSDHRALKWRPQIEVATRISKQLVKLAMGLGLTNYPPNFGEEEYRLLCRVAIHTCVGFNMEAVDSLIHKPGQNLQELSKDCNQPDTTLKEQLEDLIELGVIRYEQGITDSVGRKPHYYYVSDKLTELWEQGGLIRHSLYVKELQQEKRRTRVRTIRRKRQ